METLEYEKSLLEMEFVDPEIISRNIKVKLGQQEMMTECGWFDEFSSPDMDFLNGKNHDGNSGENCQDLKGNPLTIKSEEDIDILHHEVKSESCEQDENQGFPTKCFIGPDIFTEITCKNLNETTTRADLIQDLKPVFDVKADPSIICFGTQEETIFVKKEEVVDENITSKLYQKELSVENGNSVKHELNEYSDLKSHENEKKQFICKICSKSFKRSLRLKRHEQSHTGEKPFSCEICLQSFSYRCNLVIHERVHTGEKFRCKICSKSFLQVTNLKYHERSHDSEKQL